ncbi:FAD-dependent monooxygenase [Aeromicrobium sp. NPDC092404]|uniref:FAD-dependent monooxygenase n=1 Tax=Aeromicrobium sp. NPDC092404 TaxID=3154976 RepID=UPI003433C16D
MNQHTPSPAVIVVGAGIGGLATALVLEKAGATVTLVEKVETSTPVGAGILLQPNGLAVLSGLGLGPELEQSGFALDHISLRRADGGIIASSTVPAHAPGLDHVLTMRRSTLHAILVRAVTDAPNIDVRFGTTVIEASRSGTVTVESAHGVEVLASDLVVAADGVGSVVRRHGSFGARATPAGTTYLRAIVDTELDAFRGEFWTPLGLFGGAPLGDGSTYFYAAANAPAVAAAVADRDLDTIRRLWSDAVPVGAEAWSGVTTFDQLLVNDVVRVDAERWHDGALVLLGDAAHAMAPTLGQGANSALVDAAVLAQELIRTPDRDAALAAYAARRRPAVRAVQDSADRLAALSDLRGRLRPRLRDAAIRAATRIPAAARRQDRLAQQEDPAALQNLVASLASTDLRRTASDPAALR